MYVNCKFINSLKLLLSITHKIIKLNYTNIICNVRIINCVYILCINSIMDINSIMISINTCSVIF